MKRSLAIALAALAVMPAAAAADEPVTSVSVTVEVGSTGTVVAPEAPACELTMRLAQRPVRWRKGAPVLAAGRTYRFAGRLLCDGVPAPGGTVVEGAGEVGARGRIVARVAYRGERVIAFSAQGATVRIAVRPRR